MMKKNIFIRPYTNDDAKDLAEIYYHTIHNINAKDYSKEQIDAWAPTSALKPNTWKKKWEQVPPIVAQLDTKVAGFAELNAHGYIDCFYVHHEYQNCGVGLCFNE